MNDDLGELNYLIRAVAENPEVRARHRIRTIERLRLPANASDDEIDVAIRQENTRQGVG